jgi:intein/homing endonuclease
MEDGTTIRATAEHLFLTSNRGWVKLKDLDEEDDIISY